jgi:hypothetical protein
MFASFAGFWEYAELGTNPIFKTPIEPMQYQEDTFVDGSVLTFLGDAEKRAPTSLPWLQGLLES